GAEGPCSRFVPRALASEAVGKPEADDRVEPEVAQILFQLPLLAPQRLLEHRVAGELAPARAQRHARAPLEHRAELEVHLETGFLGAVAPADAEIGRVPIERGLADQRADLLRLERDAADLLRLR